MAAFAGALHLPECSCSLSGVPVMREGQQSRLSIRAPDLAFVGQVIGDHEEVPIDQIPNRRHSSDASGTLPSHSRIHNGPDLTGSHTDTGIRHCDRHTNQCLFGNVSIRNTIRGMTNGVDHPRQQDRRVRDAGRI